MKKGFTLIELLIVVAIIAILAAIAVPNFLEAQTRSKVSRVKADHRSLATAIESYYLDNNQYPMFFGGSTPPTNARSANELANPLPAGIATSRTFALAPVNSNRPSTITTPISYFTSYPADPFADTRGLPFRYFSNTRGWILGSFGPDADQGTNGDGDIAWGQGTYNPADNALAVSGFTFSGAETLYDPQNLTLVLGRTYDPTNGTVSSGDVWRVRD
jgi:prepilin-type N-terminal cleavage/methylation domain-containing protein